MKSKNILDTLGESVLYIAGALGLTLLGLTLIVVWIPELINWLVEGVK